MRDSILHFVEAIQSATSIDAALAVLRAALDQYGFTHVKYGLLPSHDPDSGQIPGHDPNFINRESLFAGGFHPGWEEAYHTEDFAAHDYIVEQCLLSERFVSFQDVYQKLDAGEFLGKRALVHGMSQDFDMRNGVAIPLRDSYPLARGGLSLMASNEFSNIGFKRHLDWHGEDLRQLAEAFHAALHRPLLLERGLSPRERECLLWSMRGLRAHEIAARLGTRTKTVEKQIAAARHRLRARNTTQAAVKAMLLGLISP